MGMRDVGHNPDSIDGPLDRRIFDNWIAWDSPMAYPCIVAGLSGKVDGFANRAKVAFKRP